MEPILLTIGAVITLIGAVALISPIPFGFVILIPGLTLLVMYSDKIAGFVFRRRKRHQEVDKRMDQAEDIVPDVISDRLEERTDPDCRSRAADEE